MKRILRIAIVVLSFFILGEAYLLWYTAEPVIAQAGFLGRPYYGINIQHTARFDHQYPQYGAEATPVASVALTLMRDDGATYSTWCNPQDHYASGNSCYSGHDARDFPIGMKPVLSAASGIIQEAGWWSTNHAAGLGLRIEVDHLSSTYRTVYAHLSAVRYQPTTSVGRWQIGTAGTTGNSTGVHLHFGVQVKHGGVWKITDPYGWTGASADPWYVRSGVQSTFLWLPVAQRETPLPPRGTIYQIDDGDAGTTYQCPNGPYYWPTPTYGPAINGDLHYTMSNGVDYDCLATWGGEWHGSQVDLESPGLYEVEVYIPGYEAASSTHAAKYTVYFPPQPSVSNVVVVDQSKIVGSGEDRWISLGRYTFAAGIQDFQHVTVHDNSNIGGFYECTTQHPCRTIQVDAIRLVQSH